MILMRILRIFWLRVVFLVRGKAFVMGGFRAGAVGTVLLALTYSSAILSKY